MPAKIRPEQAESDKTLRGNGQQPGTSGFEPVTFSCPLPSGAGKVFTHETANENADRLGGGGGVRACAGVLSGFFFGNLPFARHNFSLLILAIVFISLIPAALEFIKHKQSR